MPINIKKRQDTKGRTKYTATYQTPDGTWRSAGTFTARREAEVAARAAETEAGQVGWVDPKKGETTLTQYTEKVWFPSKVAEPVTLQGYDSVWRTHVKGTFGHRKINTILPSEIGTWLNKMNEVNERTGKPKVGTATQRQAWILLNQVLKSAKRDGIITVVATDGIKLPPVARPPVLIFNKAQWEAFIPQVPEAWQPLFKIAKETGLRASELRGLCPEQIEYDRMRIRVDRAVVQLHNKRPDGTRFISKDYPKSGHERYVPMSEEVAVLLVEAIDARGLSEDSTEAIFLNSQGEYFSNERTNEVATEACKAAAVPRRTFKHLRSTRASWLLKETGGDLRLVQSVLGHADIATTMKYLAVVDDVEATNVHSIDRFRKMAQEKKEAS